ncbi:SseB family protein [uncultured Jatrophihabitans sp.]|uniref:SseB family protein n=1 Tax=uncultured Jatrophihabitans sp. TaxID=1610747 RepID=UPI0035CCA135
MTTDLDGLLAQAAVSGDPAAARRFTDALLASTVGWLLAADPQGRQSPITVPTHGITAVPFFSTPDKAQDALRTLARPGLTEVPVACRDLFAQAVRNNAVTALNPFSQHGKSFTVPEMSDLLAGVDPASRTRVAGAGTTLLIGQPAYVAPGLVEGLTAYLEVLGGVDSASLAWVQYPDGLQGYLLAVRTALPRETVNAGINGPASRTEGRTLDVMVIAPGEHDPAAPVPPFFPASS